MKHLLEISQLSIQDIEHLLQRAKYFKLGGQPPDLSKHRLANLFYESSTRTRVSFELAAGHLSIPVVNLDLAHSSENKGELPFDTLKNLNAMGIDVFVIRHREEYFQQKLANQAGEGLHIINAGDGTHAHPSQALLDLMTILEARSDLSRLKIAIIGNVRHSRVANSLVQLFTLMSAKEVVLAAPEVWCLDTPPAGASQTTSLVEALTGADVVICLRVQHERLSTEHIMDVQAYRQAYAVTSETLRLAKPDAMVMHPGPVNRGVEMESVVADGPQSYILQQVSNGVFMRMAMIEFLLTSVLK